jgi:hypothetical protein
MVHTFGEAVVIDADSGMKISRISVPTNGAIPVNKKFNLVIRLLDKRIASPNNRFFLLPVEVDKTENAI